MLCVVTGKIAVWVVSADGELLCHKMLECKSLGAAIGMEGERLSPWLCCRCDSKRVCVVASACGGVCVLCYARAHAQILKYAVGCGQAAACRTP